MLLRNVGKFESHLDEFKEGIISTDELARYIMGFANADGGTLWLGVKNDGTIVGVKATEPIFAWKDYIRLQLDQATSMLMPHYIEPLQIDFNLVSTKYNQRFVITITINKSRIRYSFRNGIVYVRKAASTVIVDGSIKSNLELQQRVHELETQIAILEKIIEREKKVKPQKSWTESINGWFG